MLDNTKAQCKTQVVIIIMGGLNGKIGKKWVGGR